MHAFVGLYNEPLSETFHIRGQREDYLQISKSGHKQSEKVLDSSVMTVNNIFKPCFLESATTRTD